VEEAKALAAGEGRNWRVLTRASTNEVLHADSMKQSSGNTSDYLFDRLALVLPRVLKITQVIGANSLEEKAISQLHQ
jgi:hypothetical protein